MRGLTRILFCASFVLLGAYTWATTAGDVKQDTKKAMNTVGDYTVEQKEKIQSEMDESLASMKREIADLKARAERKGGELQKDTQEKITALQKKELELEARMEKFKASSGRAWEHMKQGMSSAMKELSKSYDKAKAQFD